MLDIKATLDEMRIIPVPVNTYNQPNMHVLNGANSPFCSEPSEEEILLLRSACIFKQSLPSPTRREEGEAVSSLDTSFSRAHVHRASCGSHPPSVFEASTSGEGGLGASASLLRHAETRALTAREGNGDLPTPHSLRFGELDSWEGVRGACLTGGDTLLLPKGTPASSGEKSRTPASCGEEGGGREHTDRAAPSGECPGPPPPPSVPGGLGGYSTRDSVSATIPSIFYMQRKFFCNGFTPPFENISLLNTLADAEFSQGENEACTASTVVVNLDTLIQSDHVKPTCRPDPVATTRRAGSNSCQIAGAGPACQGGVPH